MAKYRNTRTGAVIETTYAASGGEWVPVQAPTDAPAVATAPTNALAETPAKKAPVKKPAKKAPAKKSASKSGAKK